MRTQVLLRISARVVQVFGQPGNKNIKQHNSNSKSIHSLSNSLDSTNNKLKTYKTPNNDTFEERQTEKTAEGIK